MASGEVAYEPGYIQIYCEGAAMRQLGLNESFDRLTLFFKNLALDQHGEALPEVAEAVKAQLFRHLENPQDCVWSRLLTPKDLQHLFLFPGGNIDHTDAGRGTDLCRPAIHARSGARISTASDRGPTSPTAERVPTRADPLPARRATCVHNS